MVYVNEGDKMVQPGCLRIAEEINDIYESNIRASYNVAREEIADAMSRLNYHNQILTKLRQQRKISRDDEEKLSSIYGDAMSAIRDHEYRAAHQHLEHSRKLLLALMINRVVECECPRR